MPCCLSCRSPSELSAPFYKCHHTTSYTLLYYTILYYTILYYTILYYTILYYTILYYTILYYTILYYTMLYYTRLYYTILYYIFYSSAYIHSQCSLNLRQSCGSSSRRTTSYEAWLDCSLLRNSFSWFQV